MAPYQLPEWLRQYVLEKTLFFSTLGRIYGWIFFSLIGPQGAYEATCAPPLPRTPSSRLRAARRPPSDAPPAATPGNASPPRRPMITGQYQV